MGEDGLYQTSLLQGPQWRTKLQKESQKYFPALVLEVRELPQDAEGTLGARQDISQILWWESRVTCLLGATAASDKETYLRGFAELIKKLRKCVR